MCCSIYQELNISTIRDSNYNLLAKLYIYNQLLWFVLSKNQYFMYGNLKYNHPVSDSIQYLDKLNFNKYCYDKYHHSDFTFCLEA